LSYTSFDHQLKNGLKPSYTQKDTITAEIQVKNTGQMDGDDVLQAYIEYPQIDRMPLKELKSFKRVSVIKDSEQMVTIKIPVADLQKWDLPTHSWKLYPGVYKLILGNSSVDERLKVGFVINK